MDLIFCFADEFFQMLRESAEPIEEQLDLCFGVCLPLGFDGVLSLVVTVFFPYSVCEAPPCLENVFWADVSLDER